MSLCTSWQAQYRDGEHRFEFIEEKDGMRWERCADCGETEWRYSDTQGG